MSASVSDAASRQNVLAGVLWMALTTALFVGMDAMAKSLTQTYPVNQVTWARFFFHAVLLVAFLLVVKRVNPLHTLKSAMPTAQIVRSIAMVTTNSLFFAGLTFLTLTEMTAIMYLSPLLVTLLAIPALGEAVGWRRILSVLVGFLGALVIIRPGLDAFQPAALFGVAAAASHAVYQLATRKLAGADPHLTSLAYTALVGAVLASLALPLSFKEPSLVDWFRLAALGLIGLLSHFTFIKAFECADASVIAPFGYISLIWATLLGLFIFNELPDVWTFVGAGVVAASGLYILQRERVRRKRLASWRPSR